MGFEMVNEMLSDKDNDKNKEIKRLTKALYDFQNSLFDLTKNITQDKQINKNEFAKILKFYGMLDDFVLNVESLKKEVGGFCLSEMK
jgi:signal transduction protein with GAF and PtsI domain